MRSTNWLAVLCSFAVLSSCTCGTPSPGPNDPKVEVRKPLKLTDQARIPQNDPSFTSVDLFENRLVFHYRSPPTVKLEVGHVVVGDAGDGFLRRITGITSASASVVEVTTEPAELTDFILEGSFRVTMRPAATAWVEGDVRTRLDPVENKLAILTPGTETGFSCGASGAVDLEPGLDVDLDLELDLDIEATSYFPPRGRLVSALFAIDGEVAASLDVKSGVTFSGQCQADLIEYLRNKAMNKNLYKLKLPAIRFAIGVVPVVVTHFIEPTFNIQASLSWTTPGIQARGTVSYGLRAGAEYVNDEWTGIWEPTPGATVSMNQTGEAGTVAITAQVAPGIQYLARLYDTAGPKIGLEGTMEAKFSAAPSTCMWNTSLEAGINLVLGAELQIPAFEYKLLDFTRTYTLTKQPLSMGSGMFDGCAGTGGGSGAMTGGGAGGGGGSGGGMATGGGTATGGGGGTMTACSPSDPSLDDARTITQFLGLNTLLYGACFPLVIQTIVHSAASVPGKNVAHDFTTLWRTIGMRALWQATQIAPLFNTSPAFPCGMGPNGRTLCSPSSTMAPAGEYFVFTNVFEQPIPLADPVNHYQYGFVFDADGISTNNYVPSATYVNDFFKASDRWYTADYTPALGWSLKVVNARNSVLQTVTDSNARLIISGNTMTLAVPTSEFTTMQPSYRLTAFRHPGNYGLQPPYDYDGSLWPDVATGLQLMNF